MKCEGVSRPCETTEGVQEEACRTAYDASCTHEDCAAHPELKKACFEATDRKRNRTAWLCRACAKEYHAYWDEMWSTYYSGLI